jgi:hypothetical protein
MAIKTQKTWLEVRFTEGEVSVQLAINYEKKTFYISHGRNNQNVTFSGNEGDLVEAYTRHQLVGAALDYANKLLR